MPDQPAALRRWHAVVTSKDPALLDDLLAKSALAPYGWRPVHFVSNKTGVTFVHYPRIRERSGQFRFGHARVGRRT